MARSDSTRGIRVTPQVGDRLFVRCTGGPCMSRLVDYPPPLEIDERGGIYVLNDDGPQDDWRYFFVPSGM